MGSAAQLRQDGRQRHLQAELRDHDLNRHPAEVVALSAPQHGHSARLLALLAPQPAVEIDHLTLAAHHSSSVVWQAALTVAGDQPLSRTGCLEDVDGSARCETDLESGGGICDCYVQAILAEWLRPADFHGHGDRRADRAIQAGLTSAQDLDAGIRALHRAAELDGTLCYTFLKALALRNGCDDPPSND